MTKIDSTHFPTRRYIERPQNIVIFRALQLGDLLCTVPALRSLRRAYAKARITLVGLPWAETFVQRFSHYLDDFIEFPGWPGLPEQEPQLSRIPAFLETIQARRFDLALQMQGSGGVTNPLVALFGARQTAGYYLPGQYRPNEQFFSFYPEGEHEIRVWLRLIKSLGIPVPGEHLEFPLDTADRDSFERFRTEIGLIPGQYVCLHPGARFEGRRWPPEKFAAVGDALADRGYRVVLTGAASEAHLTAAVAKRMNLPAIDAAGLTPGLGTLALVIKNARLLISNDTGVSHVAAAVQTPSVILFSRVDPNADPDRWRPLNHNLHHIIDNAMEATHQLVLAEVNTLIGEEGPRERAAA